MHIRGWRAPLIGAALLCALVSSCGDPPVYVVVPAPPPAAQRSVEAPPAVPEGGLQAPEPVPAAPPGQEVVPPAAPPVQAPVPPPPVAAPLVPPPVVRRPGGAPPGLRAPDIPQAGDRLNKGQWTQEINKACHKAGYGNGCLEVQYIFHRPHAKQSRGQSDDSNCKIERRTPGGAGYVSLGSTILVEVSCEESSSSDASTQQLRDNSKSGQRSSENTPNQHSRNNTQNHKSTNNRGEATTQDGSG